MIRVLRRTFGVGWLGGAAGLAAFVLDELLAFVTLGYPVPPAPRNAAAYATLGALAALVVDAGRGLLRRPPAPRFQVFAGAVALLYAAAVAERLQFLLVPHAAGPVALAAAVAGAAVGGGFWLVLVSSVLAGRRTAAVPPAAMLFASFGVALGLAVNRNAVTRPLEPAALAADAAVLAATLALAWGAPRAVCLLGPRRAAIVAGGGLAVALAAVGAPSLSSPRPAKPRHPHLLLAVVDTLRLDVFRSVVDETAEGRAFRQALGNAAWFDNALATAPWTAPSVASIMTGLYPAEHGFGHAADASLKTFLKPMPGSVASLAEHLSERGYRTEAVVTNPVLHPVTGIGRGFARFETLESTAGMLPLTTLLVRAGVLTHGIYQDATAVRRRLRHRLAAAAGDPRPVFFWIHLMDPHTPLHSHPELAADPGAASLSGDERLYREETRYALAELARMLELVRARGTWDDTVFVLVSDHGEMFASDGHSVRLPGHGAWTTGHGNALYGEQVRVPLVVRPAGGLPEERRVDALVSLVDLHDTLADLLGLDLPRLGGDRVSLAPWLAPELAADPPRRRWALMAVETAHAVAPQRGLRTDSLKLIHFPHGELPDELYDLAADPAERHNLAGEEAERRRAARRLLERSRSRLRPAAASGERPRELDAETRKRLEALGYLR
ncbi:MAG TPA: sulfatase-like hydrolase/transferase [Thermoanaerobaculia bacterium]